MKQTGKEKWRDWARSKACRTADYRRGHCLQIMYGITYEELDEWVERKTVRQQRRMGNGK